MHKFEIWSAVTPVAPEHPLFGKAGTIRVLREDKPDEAAVYWDDGRIEVHPVADLKLLGS